MIRDKMQKGELVIGSWLQTGNCTVAEIMADGGFDFIAADMEHTDIGEDQFCSFARAVEGKTASLARVRENDALAIRRVLDCGAAGIIVPLIENAEQARRVVQAAKYPPVGKRGFAFCRANHWGKYFDEYITTANEQSVVMVMAETRDAIENLDDILTVDGIDGVFVGPYDLSGSYGVPGDTSHYLVMEGLQKVLDACSRKGKTAGQHIVIPTTESVNAAISDGYRFLALGMDTVFVGDGCRSILQMCRSNYFIRRMEGAYEKKERYSFRP